MLPVQFMKLFMCRALFHKLHLVVEHVASSQAAFPLQQLVINKADVESRLRIDSPAGFIPAPYPPYILVMSPTANYRKHVYTWSDAWGTHS